VTEPSLTCATAVRRRPLSSERRATATAESLPGRPAAEIGARRDAARRVADDQARIDKALAEQRAARRRAGRLWSVR
jgi:hypothetical protein